MTWVLHLAYDARSGDKLWESPTGTGVVAAPMTYELDGRQYVSIAVGWGGVYGHAQRATNRQGPGTVYTFALGGKAPLPEFAQYRAGTLLQGVKYDPALVKDGTALYVSNCVLCHGVPGVDRGGNIPNLGFVDAAFIEHLDKVVFKGPASGGAARLPVFPPRNSAAARRPAARCENSRPWPYCAPRLRR